MESPLRKLQTRMGKLHAISKIISMLRRVRRHRQGAIMLMGLTGSGKSSFIASLTGRNEGVGHSLNSCELGEGFDS